MKVHESSQKLMKNHERSLQAASWDKAHCESMILHFKTHCCTDRTIGQSNNRGIPCRCCRWSPGVYVQI